MSKIKSLVAEDYDATEGHSDPFFYPGEGEVPESFRKEAMLANFTSEELQDEIWKRMFEPFNTALEELKFTVNHFGEDKDMPF